MFKRSSGVVVLVIILLASVFNTFGGGAAQRSGIEGQVFLVQPIAPGFPVSPSEPLQVTLFVFAETGNQLRFRLIGKFETASDGTFSIALPPGNYIVGPDPSSGYLLFGTHSSQVTVAPRQVTYDEVDVISGGWGPFPG